jgi:hypothetical protein
MSSIKLVTSSNSVKNTTISCDGLGFHYEVSKPDNVVKIKRVDDSSNESVLVGELNLHKLSKDTMKLGSSSDGEWTPVKDFLTKPGSVFSQ